MYSRFIYVNIDVGYNLILVLFNRSVSFARNEVKLRFRDCVFVQISIRFAQSTADCSVHITQSICHVRKCKCITVALMLMTEFTSVVFFALDGPYHKTVCAVL